MMVTSMSLNLLSQLLPQLQENFEKLEDFGLSGSKSVYLETKIRDI